MCRIAYEIMNSLYPDASTRYTSLDDIYYFDGQYHRLNEAVLSHKANKLYGIDLQVGDQIFVDGNNWDGYSKGKNLRTELVGLYPTYKVTIYTRENKLFNHPFLHILYHTNFNKTVCFRLFRKSKQQQLKVIK